MELNPSTSSYGQTDGERGGGGKLKKPPVRKSQSTPYDRPSSNPTGRRWWLSKIVDPAYRLVASGATKILPAFLSTTPSVNALPTPATENLDKEELELPSNLDSNERGNSNVDMFQFAERAVPSEVEESAKPGQDEPNGAENEPHLSGIEQLIKGKTFTRDEINKLMEILSSGVCDVSDVDERKCKEVPTPAGANVGPLTTPFSKAADEGRWKSLNKVAVTSPKPGSRIVSDEVGASPVEIARAFMGSRLSEYGPGSSGLSSKGEAAEKVANELALKPFTPSPAPRSTCWPGSMAQKHHDYTTPNQRGRQGLHDFPRTPYSRTIYSKSRAKVQTDSKYVINSPKHFKHSQTPFPEQGRYKYDGLDNSFGSVGPIRRLRAKYASEVGPRGSIFSKYSKDNPSVGKQLIAYQDNQSNVHKNLQLGEKRTSRQPPVHLAENKVGDKPLLNPSTNEAVKRILDQLDKHKPTPQEKMSELKLASAWRKSRTEASATPKGIMSFPFSEGITKSSTFNGVDLTFKEKVSDDHSKFQDLSEINIKAKVTVREASSSDNGGSMMKSDANTGFFFPLRSTPSEPKTFQEKVGLSFNPKNHDYEQLVTTSSDASKVEPSKKSPLHSFGTKPSLPSISVSRHAPGPMSSDSVTGFSFPVTTSTSTLSEPPTPSIMPFSSGGLVSQPKDSPAIPTYSFSSNSSTPRLVFSFPSTSNPSADVDAHDLKFKFGSDKKPRVSFSSVGKDAICY